MRINKHDTQGTKPLLGKGELGYDDYSAGGDTGRVYVGTGTENIPVAKKSEVTAVDGKADAHIARVDNPHGVTKAQVGLGLADNTADASKNVLSATKWTTARTITLSGDIAGSASVDGSANVTIATTVQPNSVALGTDTTGNYVAGVTAGTGISISGTAGEGWSPTITNTAPNVTTNITTTHNAADVVVNSSDGTNGTIDGATQTLAGVMTAVDKVKLDGIAVGAQVNVPTNLSITAGTTAGPIVTSSTGTNATLPTASASASGVVTTGNQTWAGVKTFSSNPISTATQSTAVNALTRKDYVDSLDTSNVKLAGDQTIAGVKTFSSSIVGNISGNADSATTLTGLTATVDELNKIDGFTGTVTDLNYAKDLRATGVTKTEFGYLDGVTSNIQTQLNAKAPLANPTFTGTPKIVNDNIASISTSVTDNAIARYDGTTGKLQNSGVVIDDSGNVGIGTNSPFSKLNVNGLVGINGGNGDTPNIEAGLAIDAVAGGNTSLYSWLDASSIDLWAGTAQKTGIHINGQIASGGSYVSINTGGSEKMKIDSSGNLLLTSGTGALGYGAGAGGTVTQLTSKDTTVTLNKPSGRIIMSNAPLAAGAEDMFLLYNSLIGFSDTLTLSIPNLISNDVNNYKVRYTLYNGGALIFIKNISGSTLSEAISINFNLHKGVLA